MLSSRQSPFLAEPSVRMGAVPAAGGSGGWWFRRPGGSGVPVVRRFRRFRWFGWAAIGRRSGRETFWLAARTRPARLSRGLAEEMLTGQRTLPGLITRSEASNQQFLKHLSGSPPCSPPPGFGGVAWDSAGFGRGDRTPGLCEKQTALFF